MQTEIKKNELSCFNNLLSCPNVLCCKFPELGIPHFEDSWCNTWTTGLEYVPDLMQSDFFFHPYHCHFSVESFSKMLIPLFLSQPFSNFLLVSNEKSHLNLRAVVRFIQYQEFIKKYQACTFFKLRYSLWFISSDR